MDDVAYLCKSGDYSNMYNNLEAVIILLVRLGSSQLDGTWILNGANMNFYMELKFSKTS